MRIVSPKKRFGKRSKITNLKPILTFQKKYWKIVKFDLKIICSIE